MSITRQNKFCAGILDEDLVNIYYPNHPGFDHFVFQQMIGNATGTEDHYKLVVFAVDQYGTVLNNGVGYHLDKVNPPQDLLAHPCVQFANMKLTLTDLYNLYGNEPVVSLLVVPAGFYNGTDYIYYDVSRLHGLIGLGGTIHINPSPPA